MKRTTAPGSSGGQYVDDNASLSIVGTLLVASDRNIIQEELCAPIEGVGITLDGGVATQLWKAMRKLVAERSKQVGELFYLSERKTPVAFGGGTEDTYFPAICLTDFSLNTDISDTNWPDLVPFLRGIKTIYKENISGAISSPTVTDWSITSNVVTLTFQNDADHIAFLTALAEDQSIHGSYTNWRTITIPTTFGNVVAGTYAITAITPASRTLTFALTASNGSGAGTWSADFYPHRIAGSTTTARLFSLRGMTLHGASDDNGYFLASSLRRRGYFQGHYHGLSNPGDATGLQGTPHNSRTSANTSFNTSVPTPDGTNGTPRTAKETHGPAQAVHVYMHGKRYI